MVFSTEVFVIDRLVLRQSIIFVPLFPDQHHWAGSWGPRSRGSGAAVHGQPKLAGHPLQLLHRAAHAQHQSLRRLRAGREKEVKQEDFQKKSERRHKITERWILLYSPPSLLKSLRYEDIFFVCFLKAIVEHKGDLFVWPGHQSPFFYSCCWSKTKDTSYFVRRKRTPPVQGSLAGQEGNDRRKGRWKDKEEEEPQRQVNGGATDILLTVRHKDNS